MRVNTTELRVHGVGRSSAEEILDRPIASRVAGDRDAGFYRPRPDYGEQTGPGGALIEAYRWGNLTGRTAIRTFSLVLLLPFMLSNLAIWMLPPTIGSGAVSRAICRLLGGTLTVMYVLSVVGAVLDLLAWQCAAYPRCLEGQREISWLGGIQPGQRLAIMAVVPVAAIATILWIGARSWRLPEDAAAEMDPGRLGADRLDSPDFWDSRIFLRRLRALHVAIALGTVDVALLAVLAPHDRHPVGYTMLALTAGLIAAAAALLCLPARIGRPIENRRIGVACRAARIAATGLTLLTILYAAVPRDRWIPGPELPSYDRMVAWLYMGQVTLILILGVVVLTRRQRTAIPAFLDGLGAPVIVSIAIGLGVAFSSGLVYTVAEYLNRGSKPTPARPLPAGAPPLVPPVTYRWAAVGFLVAVLVAGIAAVVRSRLTLWHRRRAAMEILRSDFPDAPPDPQPRVRAVRDAIARAQMTDRTGPLPAAYAVLAVLTLGSAGFALAGIGPGALAKRVGGRPMAGPVVFVTDLGANLTGVFAIAMAVAALFAYRSNTLRFVDVLWDLATFWPRVAHPLAPPCYSERAVPELTRWIRYLTRNGGSVVLSGHSHGAVLVAATARQLPASCLDRVALLTYASPLRRLYSRVFPTFMGESMLREVGDRLGWRWINLWRDTDPIGGWTFRPDAPSATGTYPSTAAERPAGSSLPDGRPADPADGVDRRLRDPVGLLTLVSDTVPPPIRGHRFDPDGHFQAAVCDLVSRVRA